MQNFEVDKKIQVETTPQSSIYADESKRHSSIQDKVITEKQVDDEEKEADISEISVSN